MEDFKQIVDEVVKMPSYLGTTGDADAVAAAGSIFHNLTNANIYAETGDAMHTLTCQLKSSYTLGRLAKVYLKPGTYYDYEIKGIVSGMAALDMVNKASLTADSDKVKMDDSHVVQTWDIEKDEYIEVWFNDGLDLYEIAPVLTALLLFKSVQNGTVEL